MNNERQVRAAAELIAGTERCVVFTGAGISTESGLPDFRGPDGVWTRRDQGRPPPKGPRIEEVRPNAAHEALVRLQEMERLSFLISQNVDDLHRASGIDPARLAELHGNARRLRCPDCERTIPKKRPAPCPCGSRQPYRSSVINFGDTLPLADMDAAWCASQQAEVFVVIGSTLLVTPAADLPARALENGAKLIIINLGETPLDERAHIRITGRAGEVTPAIVDRVANFLA